MLSSILLLSRVTTDDEPVWVQLRLRDNLGNAVASEPMRVEVGEVFKDGVI